VSSNAIHFGTSGWRAIIADEFSFAGVRLAAAAIAERVRKQGTSPVVLVGYDTRFFSEEFARAAGEVLQGRGIRVLFCERATPTPAIAYEILRRKLAGAINITASHNPPEYNGLKVMGNSGVELPHEEEAKIEGIFFKSKWTLTKWDKVKQPLPVAEKFSRYIESILENVEGIPKQAGLKVLVDAANGVSALSMPTLIERLGGRVSVVNGRIDGTFPGRMPEPTPDHLRNTTRILPTLHADFGVAHDGDGDRAVFLDEHGSVCWGDHTFALIVRDFLENNPGEKIVTPISSSLIIEEIAEKYGGEVVYTPVGSVYVSNMMLKIRAKLGGEENGGIFYAPHVAARDGGITTAMIYRILAETKKPLSKLVSQLPKTFIVKDKLPCANAIKSRVTEALKNLPRKGKVLDIDGIKVWIPPRAWILIRPSGTEPIFRILAEAPTKGMALRIVGDYKTKLSRIIKDCLRRA
jgi:phosphomannomutase/phosphoglucomutase